MTCHGELTICAICKRWRPYHALVLVWTPEGTYYKCDGDRRRCERLAAARTDARTAELKERQSDV